MWKCYRCGKECNEHSLRVTDENKQTYCNDCWEIILKEECTSTDEWKEPPAVPMNEGQRLEIFRKNLTKIVEEGLKGAFVIFDSGCKFVQFAGDNTPLLMVDIPEEELSKEERKRLLSMNMFNRDLFSGISYQYELIKELQNKQVNELIEEAVQLTERIFIEVFKLPNNYGVKTELFLGHKDRTKNY